MKKIKYFANCENEYLKSLGLMDEKDNFTITYEKLNNEWKSIKNINIKCIFPKEICDLITASYENLVDWIISLFLLSELDYSKVKKDIDNLKLLKYKGIYDKKIADFFIKYSSELNIYSCFYCDSSFSGIYRNNKKNERTFDVEHFFPNEQYPMFSISLYNFIPSCQVCNSRVKGSSNFLDFYNLDKTSSTIKNKLLNLSPTSEIFNINEYLKIKIYPSINYFTYYRKSHYEKWSYCPCFSKAKQSYQIFFDVDKKTPYLNHIKAFKLQERYNNVAIKSQGLYLEDLKRKYPDSNLKLISELLNKGNTQKLIKGFSYQEIKDAIFHQDNKYALLQKMRNDIIYE